MKSKTAGTFIVYQAVNTINGQRYVGATGQTLALRRSCHMSHARNGVRSCRAFMRALRRYGENAFKWEVLGTFNDLDTAHAEERRLIDETKPAYNLARGGGGAVALTPKQKRRWVAKYHRPYKPICCLDDGLWFKSVRDAAAHYGIRPGRISSGLCGHEIAPCGQHFVYAAAALSNEERDRLLLEMAERRAIGQERRRISRCRAVRCYTHGDQWFESGRAAAAAFGMHTSRIMQLCNDGGTTRDGVGFMYANAEAPPIRKTLTPEQRAAGAARQQAALDRSRALQAKAVICTTDGTTYPSVHAAGRAYGFRATRVSTAIYRGRPTGGLHFVFAGTAT